MPRNRNNENKEFAIGTKITYNGKLYEVVEQKFCDNCSIANICTNSEISSGNNIGDVISRDQRLNIFGECSAVSRSDGTSIIFKEIDSNKEYYNIAPLYKSNDELLPIKINLPDGYKIDTIHSDLNKGVIYFNSKWLTLKQLYKLVKVNNYHSYRSEIKNSTDDKSNTVTDKLVALTNLMDIARYFNGNWNYNVTKEEDIGYVIVYDGSIKAPNYTIRRIEACSNIYYGNIIFKNEADAQYVIDNPNFRDILDTIFKS